MAINKNHEFEELNGIKCSIVERNIEEVRMIFLKDLLSFNQHNVVVVTVPAAAPSEGEDPKPDKFTVGVSDLTFNPTNAVFGRQLKTRTGNIVTLAYWQQQSPISEDGVPYFEVV
jgi:hypothetical protein